MAPKRFWLICIQVVFKLDTEQTIVNYIGIKYESISPPISATLGASDRPGNVN